MINYKEHRTDKFFTCDKCGRGYSFISSYLTVSKGDKYRPAGSDEILTASQDLCRDCAGQTPKFAPGVEAQMEAMAAKQTRIRLEREIQDIVNAA